MSNLLSFIGGSMFGVYISQNYEIPNVKKTGQILMDYIKSLEKVYESGTDWVRISWMKTAYINKWIPKSGERQLDWNHFSN